MNKLVFDQDSQKGFLAKPIESVLANIEELYRTAFRNEINVASCTYYLEGEASEKLPETILVDAELYYNVPITRHGIDMNLVADCYHINFEHTNGNIFDTLYGQPDNFMTYLRTEEIDEVYLMGNNYTGAILDTCRGLLKSKFKVAIVRDAINNLTEYVEEELLKLSTDLGNLRFITTEDAIGELSE